MPRESDTSEHRRPIASKRRFKPHDLLLADGGRLLLRADGSIDQLSDDGAITRSWAPDDADWPRQALRFGVRAEVEPVTPPGRQRWAVPPRR